MFVLDPLLSHNFIDVCTCGAMVLHVLYLQMEWSIALCYGLHGRILSMVKGASSHRRRRSMRLATVDFISELGIIVYTELEILF